MLGYIDENNYVSMWAPSPSENSFINLKHNGAYTFYVEANGYLYASNATIKGTIEAGTIISNGVKLGSSGITEFYDFGGGTTWRYINGKGGYISIVDHAIYIQSYGSGYAGIDIGSIGNLTGTWKLNSSATVTSDATHKNTIIALTDERYDILFDSLIPSIFKYNDGMSDRFHSGFVAQQFYDAVIKAGLTTKDLAAVCYDTDKQGEKINWAIRYDEIIALNTRQIQKMKKKFKS